MKVKGPSPTLEQSTLTKGKGQSGSETPFAITPKQQRGQLAERKLVDALAHLLATESFETITVSQIATKARLAVGTVYRRFPSKEHLLFHVANDVGRTQLMPLLERTARKEAWAKLPARELIGRYLAFVALIFRRHRPLLRAGAIVSRLDLEPGLTQLVRENNRIAHDQFRALLVARKHEIRHQDPYPAIDLGILWVSAALREIVLFEEPVSGLGQDLSLNSVVTELTAAMCAYLQIRDEDEVSL